MRLRVTFSKTGSLRYTGHLDLHTIWERTARRAGLPLAYSQGFHPGPRIQMAAALPLGFSGLAEIVDLWLGAPVDLAATQAALRSAVPPGLGILAVEEADERAPALQTQTDFADYEVTLLDAVDEAALAERIAGLLGAATLPRERRGKAYDLRPLIESLALAPAPSINGSGPRGMICMRLACREGATGRPEEVLDALGVPFETVRVARARLILKTVIE
jgi:radical SAM-linked protein